MSIKKIEKKISVNKVPNQFRGKRSSFSQWLGAQILSIMGWQISGCIPNEKRIVLVAAPHTSNWDFILAMATILTLNLNIKWLGKKSLFKLGVSWFFKWLGGIPVDRNNPNKLIDQIVQLTDNEKGLIIAVAPEGSRKKVSRWKSGFLRISNLTKSKILFISLDAPTKTLKLGPLFQPSQDTEKDIIFVMDYFKQFKGINSSQS